MNPEFGGPENRAVFCVDGDDHIRVAQTAHCIEAVPDNGHTGISFPQISISPNEL